MRDRRVVAWALAATICLLVLLVSCTGVGLAVHSGRAPAVDWQIPLGSYRTVLIHNGPTISCARGLRDSCRRQLVRYEFYVHYMTPTADRTLIWVPTTAP